jgi:HPt (histidine-containing phosphotransfer) domain-containing protein
MRVNAVMEEYPERPIDPAVLKTLRALQREGRPDILATLVTLFTESCRTLLVELERAAGELDIALLRQASHSLKSAGANVGALPFSNRCKELERMARSGSVPNPTARVKVIVAEYRRAEAALLAYMAQASEPETRALV